MSLVRDMSLPVDLAPAGNGDVKHHARSEGRGRAARDDGAFARIVRQMNRLMEQADAKAAGDAGAAEGETTVSSETPAENRETRQPASRHAATRHSLAHAMFVHGDWNRPAGEAASETLDAAPPAHDADAGEDTDTKTTGASAGSDEGGDLAGAAAVTVPATLRPEVHAAPAEQDAAEGGDTAVAGFATTGESAQRNASTGAEALQAAAPRTAASPAKPLAGAVPPEADASTAAENGNPDTDTAAARAAPPAPSDMEPTEQPGDATMRVTARETHLPPPTQTATAAAGEAGTVQPKTLASTRDATLGPPEPAASLEGPSAPASQADDSGDNGKDASGDNPERHAASAEAPARGTKADGGAQPAPLAAATGTAAATSVAAPQATAAPLPGLPDLASSLAATLKGQTPAAPGITAAAPPAVTVAPGPVRSVSVTLETAEHGALDVRMRLGDNGLDVHLRAERSETAERLRHDQAALAHLLRDHGYDTATVRVEARHATASSDAGVRADVQSGFGNGGAAADLAGGGRQAPADDRQPRLPDGVTPFDADEPSTVSHDPAPAAARGTSGLYL